MRYLERIILHYIQTTGSGLADNELAKSASRAGEQIDSSDMQCS